MPRGLNFIVKQLIVLNIKHQQLVLKNVHKTYLAEIKCLWTRSWVIVILKDNNKYHVFETSQFCRKQKNKFQNPCNKWSHFLIRFSLTELWSDSISFISWIIFWYYTKENLTRELKWDLSQNSEIFFNKLYTQSQGFPFSAITTDVTLNSFLCIHDTISDTHPTVLLDACSCSLILQ